MAGPLGQALRDDSEVTYRDEIISLRGTILSQNVILTMLLVRIPVCREQEHFRAGSTG